MINTYAILPILYIIYMPHTFTLLIYNKRIRVRRNASTQGYTNVSNIHLRVYFIVYLRKTS